MHFYKRFIGDYRKKTARLTPLEHGVYGLLLDEFYATEAPLPLDAGELANIVGARTDADKAAIKKVLGRYFTKSGAGWVNPRAEEEVGNTRKFSAAQKSRADKRWSGDRSGNAETVPNQYRGDAEPVPDHMPGEYPTDASHSQTPQPKPESITTAKNKGPTARLSTRQDGNFDLESFKAVYPKRAGAQPWARAARAVKARIKGGSNLDDMILGARRYADFCEAGGKTGTAYVMQAATFLGPELHFLELWEPPASKASGVYDRNAQRVEEYAAAMPDIPPFLDRNKNE